MIPTAAEFFDKGNFNNVTDMLIEFAKLHVEAALKAAAENASSYVSVDDEPTVSKGSIFSAYRLSNIK